MTFVRGMRSFYLAAAGIRCSGWRCCFSRETMARYVVASAAPRRADRDWLEPPIAAFQCVPSNHLGNAMSEILSKRKQKRSARFRHGTTRLTQPQHPISRPQLPHHGSPGTRNTNGLPFSIASFAPTNAPDPGYHRHRQSGRTRPIML